MVKYVYLIPIFPFLAFWLNILLGKQLGRLSAWIAIGASLLSTILTFGIFFGMVTANVHNYTCSLGSWISINGQTLSLGILVDNLTLMMLSVVTVVGTLIQIYSVGYMSTDIRFTRYFAYISLFMASMLALVLVDDLLMLYIFWEGVGLCSCLLIAFWHEKPAAAAAGVKAFITTRIGDTGLLIGILILLASGHSLRFTDLGAVQGSEVLMTVAALLIFLGAMGKSAQFPLHVWLPDAMEGPTAISALIHAATMVAAGVYLVARSYVFFIDHPLALHTIAVIGAISAVMAASIACTANDIKRILAYSTISQLGLMMLALGVGGYVAGTFHLMTHAFFKALLFLGAGSVIHAVHTQDIHQMGGLLHRMKVTGITFIIGALALAGVGPLSGFWSKDEIFIALWQSGHPVLFAVAVLTSFLTAFYMARVIFVAFLGISRRQQQIHESPLVMTIPLIILAFFAVFLGFLGAPWCINGAFQHFISPAMHEVIHMNWGMVILSSILSLTAITLAYLIFVKGFRLPSSGEQYFVCFYKLIENKYYIDEIHEKIFIKPFHQLCSLFKKFDCMYIDGVIHAVATVTAVMASYIRRWQTGRIENYLFYQICGIFILLMVISGKLCRIF